MGDRGDNQVREYTSDTWEPRRDKSGRLFQLSPPQLFQPVCQPVMLYRVGIKTDFKLCTNTMSGI